MSTDRSPGASDADDDLLAEIKALRDGTEELLILLNHIWQQRDELRFKLSTVLTGRGREAIEETICCYECDAPSPPSLAQALLDGWIDLQLAAKEDGEVNFAGWCPPCQQAHGEAERRLNQGSADPMLAQATSRALEHAASDNPEPATTQDRETTNESPPRFSQPSKQTPLHLRLSFQRHMTEIVRAIGYEVLSRDDATARLRPIIDRYGRPTVDAALEELLDTGAAPTVRLRSDVRQFARQILGPPPVANADQPQVVSGKPTLTSDAAGQGAASPRNVGDSNETLSAGRTGQRISSSGNLQVRPFVVPTTDIRKLKPVKLPRNKVLPEFEEHLQARGIPFERIDDCARRKYTDKHLGALDFIIREEGEPPELVTIRRTVTKTQLHDLSEWKRIVGNAAFVSMIWPYLDDAGRQSWETTELCTQEPGSGTDSAESASH